MQKRKHWSGNRGRSSLINPTSNRLKLFKLLKLQKKEKNNLNFGLLFRGKKKKKKEGKVAIEATGTEIEFAGYDGLDFHPLE